MTKKMCEKLFKEFKGLETDKERWAWIIKNHKRGITLRIDVDDTYATFDGMEKEYMLMFDSYLGWSDGVFDLLDCLGVECADV